MIFQIHISAPQGATLACILRILSKRLSRRNVPFGRAIGRVVFRDDEKKPHCVRRADAAVLLHECNKCSSIDFEQIVWSEGARVSKDHDDIEISIEFLGR